MLIVIDGIDGAGKTTICDELFMQINSSCQFHRTPGGGISAVRDLVLNPDIDMDKTARMFFFLGEMIHINKKFNLENTSGKIIIFDRFYISTYVYQFLMRMDDFSNKEIGVIKDIFRTFMPKIDLSVILSTDIDTAMQRSGKFFEYGKRDVFESDRDDIWRKRKYFYDSIELCDAMRNKMGEVMRIDTTNITQKDVAGMIIGKIKEIITLKPEI